MWLFQEGERVSSDRLFRVRAKQPYSCISKPEQGTLADPSVTIPTVSQTVMVGIFMFPNDEWRIGKVHQFCYMHERKKKSQQYKGVYAEVMPKKANWSTLLMVFFNSRPKSV